jgi:hypothetical protein
MRPLLLAALVACAPPVAYRADVSFTDDEHAQIWRAASEWNRHTKPEKRITLGNEWRVLKAEPPGGFGYNGLCRRSVKTIWIRPQPFGATTYEVAVHEWGHALGLGHTTTGVMMPNTVSTEFTPEVMAECKRVGACP